MKFKFLKKREVSRLSPTAGIYCFKSGREFLYVGKASNLRERVKNHSSQPAYRDNLFIDKVKKIGYIKTDSEIEALILEANLIKKYQPKYNVVWRDDKNYFFVGQTKEDFPTIFITHQPSPTAKVKGQKSKVKIKYIGPFVEGRSLKRTLEILRKIFPYRTCKPYAGKPCLWYQLDRCPGPCLLGSKLAQAIPDLEQKIKNDSRRNVKNLSQILEGENFQVLRNLKKEMKEASKIQDFEKAAKIRDQITSLKRVLAQAKVLETMETKESDWEKIEKKIKEILGTKLGISRIEAYDVSNIQGKEATGSMITFVNGKPDKNLYRRFKIKITGQPNDLAMLKEVLSRRFSHPEWGWPDLILIDGGLAQLHAATETKNQQPKSKRRLRVMALAKKENKLFMENQKRPILVKSLPREIFNLMLYLRDEAHRFAISYHRKLRAKLLLGS